MLLGGLQHFIEYPTAQLLQAQQSQQPQFIQHNGQLVQVIRPSVAYSAPTFMQQIQLQQQQQQAAQPTVDPVQAVLPAANTMQETVQSVNTVPPPNVTVLLLIYFLLFVFSVHLGSTNSAS